MKKIKSIIALIVISLFISVPGLMSQATAPSDPPGGPVGGDEPIGGGAPVSGGTIILIGLAAAYGGKKVFNISQQPEE